MKCKEILEGIVESFDRDQVSKKEAQYILSKLEQDEPIENFLDQFPELHRMKEEISRTYGLHLDDDVDEINNHLINDIENIANEEATFEADTPVGKITKVDPATKKAVLTNPDGTTQEVDPKSLKPTPDGKLKMDTPDPNQLKPGTQVVTGEDVHRTSGMAPMGQGELGGVNVKSAISGDEDHDEITKLLIKRMRRLAGVS